MLTAQKRKFALALMTGASKKDAAINAGYSEKSARSKGSQLAKDPEVIAFIERKKREKNEVDEYPTGGKNVYTPAVNIPDEDRDDTGPENLINNVFDDPLDFLRTVMNCSLVELNDRKDAAKAMLPYMHAKKGEGGKKDAKKDAAVKALASKFGAMPAPRLVASNEK
ncbi:terminase small subunit [Escherichia albertii]|uniref:terminase small subunit n=1 Tax=Escherichia albertii TaxID=208962 RepID=UPI0017BE392A|nr:terminase small subunit [Escherichia albertii]MCI5275806.1 terminase small subunit [Escherichia albertii]MCZ8661452.1 terminase small subunit [Escherichia albertii]MCZ9009740.1 terminase small subunit [Escherichia albertii]HCZ5333290.1 terminase small subunit [Escherichia albertii]